MEAVSFNKLTTMGNLIYIIIYIKEDTNIGTLDREIHKTFSILLKYPDFFKNDLRAI